MPTEIPQSITEEETKEPLAIHGFQEGILLFILLSTGIFYITRSPLPYQVNIFVIAIYFIGSFVGFRYLKKNGYKILLYQKSFKNSSFFDRSMENFFSIKEVKNNTVVFRDNSMMAVLQVQPIDGSLLEEKEIKLVTEIFNGTLKSIPYTIHVFSHSVEPNLDDFFVNTERKIVQNSGKNMEQNLRMNRQKGRWLEERMRDTRARDRENYFAIVYKARGLQVPVKESTKFLLGVKEHNDLAPKDVSQTIIENSIKEVNSVINTASIMLEKTGVKTRRLDDNQLINLYPSYFMNIRGIGTSHLSPIMWHEAD